RDPAVQWDQFFSTSLLRLKPRGRCSKFTNIDLSLKRLFGRFAQTPRDFSAHITLATVLADFGGHSTHDQCALVPLKRNRRMSGPGLARFADALHCLLLSLACYHGVIEPIM